jgi:hypothetical protein
LPRTVRNYTLERNAFHELVTVVDVEDHDAGAAVVHVVAATDARQRRINESLNLLGVRMRRQDCGCEYRNRPSGYGAKGHRDLLVGPAKAGHYT